MILVLIFEMLQHQLLQYSQLPQVILCLLYLVLSRATLDLHH